MIYLWKDSYKLCMNKVTGAEKNRKLDGLHGCSNQSIKMAKGGLPTPGKP